MKKWDFLTHCYVQCLYIKCCKCSTCYICHLQYMKEQTNKSLLDQLLLSNKQFVIYYTWHTKSNIWKCSALICVNNKRTHPNGLCPSVINFFQKKNFSRDLRKPPRNTVKLMLRVGNWKTKKIQKIVGLSAV